MLITNLQDLEQFAKRAKDSSVLAIDTEFLREKTYYPQLCLLQLATEEEVAIVDPLACHDLTPLVSLFEDENIVKLFHAGSQDIEIIYHELGVIPHPLFDTQIAGSVLGHSLQTGYGALVQSECGITLKKGDSFTDWSRRPLAKSQLDYAAEDVIYLPKMYTKMKARLERLGRIHWLDREFAQLSDSQRYVSQPREMFRKLKRVNQLSGRQLSAAREVAAWREESAMRRNIPRKWVLSDEQVVEACRRESHTIDQLFMVRGMKEKLSTDDARSVAFCIERGLQTPKQDWPRISAPSHNEASVDLVVSAMEAILRLRAKEHDVAYQAIASHADLVSIARGHTDSELLHGWRYEIVGKDLLSFAQGRLLLSVEDGQLKVTERQ